MIADLMDNFESIKTLLSTLGYPVFDRITSEVEVEIYYCKGKDASAKGEYTDEGFVVYKDSVCNIELSATAGTSVTKMREEMMERGIIVPEGNVLRFTENHIFSSPSAAAAAVLARRANGWTEWKDVNCQTLDQLKRQG